MRLKIIKFLRKDRIMENPLQPSCEGEKEAEERSPIAKECDRVEKALQGAQDAFCRLATQLDPIILATPHPDPENSTSGAKSQLCGVIDRWAGMLGALHADINRLCEDIEL